MKTLSSIAIVLAVNLSAARAQFSSADHSVTVQVTPITVLQVSSGSVNLNIAGGNAVAGEDAMSIVDQSTSLLWGSNSSAKKISISSNLVAPVFTLKAVALNPTQGLAAPEATLASTPADFLLNIGRSTGSCVIQYTGIALASQGTGTDAHTITLTIQTQ